MSALAHGSAFVVYDAWSVQRRCRCIVKMLAPGVDSPTLRRRLALEGRLLTRLDHPHLLHGYEVRRDPALVASRTVGGLTLASLIEDAGRLGPGDVAHLAGQLASGLGYLHDSGYLHLDVKPANVVVDAGLAVLIDFSLVQRAGRVRAGTGTPWYMAPEQVRGGRVDAATDVWGLGATLYQAATGIRAFAEAWTADDDARPPAQLPQSTGRAIPLVRRRPRFPRALARIIDGCLEPEAAARPSLADVTAVCHELTGEGPPVHAVA